MNDHNSSTFQTENDTPKKNIREEVTNRIILQLEQGNIPWEKPWQGNSTPLTIPKNAVTGNRYNGINILLLWSQANEKKYTINQWASFKQWKSKGESIRQGEKGQMIVYTDVFEKEVEGVIQKFPFLKQAYVFNRCQLESYSFHPQDIEGNRINLVEKLESVENFLRETKAVVEHKGEEAYYDLAADKIVLPPLSYFLDTASANATEGYYAVAFHEWTHWTGHEKRNNRKIQNDFGDESYATEELTAEFGAAFLCAEYGIMRPEKTHHAGYIANWLPILKENKDCLFTAASQASKAVDYLQKLQPK